LQKYKVLEPPAIEPPVPCQQAIRKGLGVGGYEKIRDQVFAGTASTAIQIPDLTGEQGRFFSHGGECNADTIQGPLEHRPIRKTRAKLRQDDATDDQRPLVHGSTQCLLGTLQEGGLCGKHVQ